MHRLQSSLTIGDERNNKLRSMFKKNVYRIYQIFKEIGHMEQKLKYGGIIF